MNENKVNSELRGFYIENLGCAKNQVDAETIIAALEDAGWKRVIEPGDAELIIVNSCGFIEDARKESIDVTLSFRQLYPGKRLILAGCLSERNGTELASILPEIDGIFGNRAPAKIPEMLSDVLAGKRPVFLPKEYQSVSQRGSELSTKGISYLKVAEGCDNRCSFCSIPLIRGGLRSRSIDEIVEDAKKLIDAGTAEINLIAQDLGSFGADRGKRELPNLLEKILALPGKYWLRLLYIHPDRFPRELFELCGQDARLLPYFDLPVQHGSRRILQQMGRTGDAATYLALIEEIRANLPDAVIRSTFLLGFPGESREDFAELRAFQEKAAFDWLGAFAYSREEGTRAYSIGALPGITHRAQRTAVERRILLVQEAQQRISEQRMQRFVGTEADIFIEESIQGEQLYFGRTRGQAPEVDGLVVVHSESLPAGTFVPCKIVKVNGIDLEAVPV
jgi:ribosomal protein S12 methylthiotransferase